ncbi:MAG: type II secretion system protein GspD [Verrucomicrobia bacterium]|nr:type II secretion system protein GspD [Verrucomicrobiota bacterium]MCH8527617.1 hypothetical protein [Kiritimatiellia bacterium]
MKSRIVFPLSLILLLLGLWMNRVDAAATVHEFDVRDVPLGQALDMLGQVTQSNLTASRSARDIPVRFQARNLSLDELLQALAASHGLWMSGRIGETPMVVFHTLEEYRRDAETLRPARTEVFTLRYPHSRAAAQAIADLFGSRVQIDSRLTEDPAREELNELSERLRRLDLIGGRGSLDLGAGGRAARAGTGQTRERRLREDDRRLRSRDQTADEGLDFQDLTPAEIQRLEIGTLEDQLAAADRLLRRSADIHVTTNDRNNQIIVRTRDHSALKDIRSLIAAMDRPTPMVLLEVRILRVDLGNEFESTFDWVVNSTENPVSFNQGNPVNTGALVHRFLDERIRTTLQILERRNKLTTLGRPLLLTANQEVSRLFIGEEVPLNRDFTAGDTIVTPGGPVVSPSATRVEFRPVGSTLLVTPSINDDRTVTLRILQEESNINRDARQVLVPDGLGGFVSRNIDTVATQSATGTFIAADGQTLAIGGLIREEISDQRSQVPILGSLPLIGIAFRSERTLRQRREIVILMTPHILASPEDAERMRQQIEADHLHPVLEDGARDLNLFQRETVLP